jgi:chromosome segregation ATPase
MNSVTLKDLQSEMSCNADLFDLIAFLGETIQKDRKEEQKLKSMGKDRSNNENAELRRKIEDLQDRLREYELSRTNHIASRKDNINKDLMRDLEEADAQLEELRRIKENLEHDNRRLRDEVKYLEENPRKGSAGLNRTNGGANEATGAVLILRKENESQKHEIRNLKERISQLSMELDAAVQQAAFANKQSSQRPQSSNNSRNAALESEIQLLREKERDY